MHAGCRTNVTTSEGKTVSSLLFVIKVYVKTDDTEDVAPWVMMFADDLVLCDPGRDMMEVRQERRR